MYIKLDKSNSFVKSFVIFYNIWIYIESYKAMIWIVFKQPNVQRG